MTLVLELPEETERQLREAASSRGQEILQFLVEAANRTVYSLEAASQELNLADSSLRERAERGELESLTMDGELFFVRDARFEALQRLQAERMAGLQELTRITEELGLYEHQQR